MSGPGEFPSADSSLKVAVCNIHTIEKESVKSVAQDVAVTLLLKLSLALWIQQ